MGEYLIGIDCSTQSTKAVAWDLQGRAIAEGRAPLRVSHPAPGWAEQDPAEWWESTAAALRQVAATVDARRVLAVGLAWQRETFLALDADWQPLRPAILWLDQRATREAAEARQDFGAERFLEITGKQLDTTPSFVKLLWMRAQEPERFRRVAHILDVGGYLAGQLTGEARSCTAGGDSLGLMGTARGAWSEDLMGYLGLPTAVLPAVVPPGAPLGRLSSEAAEATGLRASTPVVAAGGDGQVFAVGAHAPGRDAFSLTVGTSLVLGLHWPSYRVGPAYRTMAGCYPDSFLLEAVLRAGADIVRWFVQDFARGQSEEAMEAAISNVPAGCLGLLTVPYWKGRMVPTNAPLARGVTVGWSDYHTQAHFYRSILEGMAYEVRLCIESYERELGVAPSEIHMGGGGALSPTWRQIMADVSGKEVVLSAAESTALGAAMLAATAIGAYATAAEASAAMYRPTLRIAPRPQVAALYDGLYRDYYAQLYPLLEPILVALGRQALEKNTPGR